MMPIEFRGSFTPRHLVKIQGRARKVMGGEPMWSGVAAFGLGTVIAVAAAIGAAVAGKQRKRFCSPGARSSRSS